MQASFDPVPLEAGAGRRHALVRSAFLLLCLSTARAADVAVSGGPVILTVGAAQLQAGPGTDFQSPVAIDVLVAVLDITNTGGGAWSLMVARDVNEAQWPSGVTISLRRSGGSTESGIDGGLSYHTLTGDEQPFFSGAGDYSNVVILLRLQGITTQTPPAIHSLSIRYVIEAP